MVPFVSAVNLKLSDCKDQDSQIICKVIIENIPQMEVFHFGVEFNIDALLTYDFVPVSINGVKNLRSSNNENKFIFYTESPVVYSNSVLLGTIIAKKPPQATYSQTYNLELNNIVGVVTSNIKQANDYYYLLSTPSIYTSNIPAISLCGNGKVDFGEVCDSSVEDLLRRFNNKTCQTEVPGSIGSLICTNDCKQIVTTSCVVNQVCSSTSLAGCPAGDLDGDNTVRISDLFLMINVLTNQKQLTSSSEIKAYNLDCSIDNKININDLFKLLNAITEKEVLKKCP